MASESSYSNGLNYVPYQSKKHAKRPSNTDQPLSPQLSASSDVGSDPPPMTMPLIRPTITPSTSASSQATMSSTFSDPPTRPVIAAAGIGSGQSTFRRLGGPRPSATGSVKSSPLRPKPVSAAPSARPSILVLGADSEAPTSESESIRGRHLNGESSKPAVVSLDIHGPGSSLLQPALELSSPTGTSSSASPPPPTSTPALAPAPAVIQPRSPPTSNASLSPRPAPTLLPDRERESYRPRSSSPAGPISSTSSPIPFLLPNAPSPAPSIVPPPPPASSAPSPAPKRAPYRAGFQPRGAYRVLTDEFISAREKRLNPQVKSEERRLERRLEKLVGLHFPSGLEFGASSLSSSSSTPTISTNGSNTPTSRTRTLSSSSTATAASTATAKSTRRSSSFFDFSSFSSSSIQDFTRHARSPSDLLKTVTEPKAGSPAAIRAAEQVITPWQDDSKASACPHCTASFHPITNRKHHCRLCGLVVCALPPKKPIRPRPCSLLVTLDPPDAAKGRIKEVPEKVAYGVAKRPSLSVGGKEEAKEGEVESFRICKNCWAFISRRELMYEARAPTPFTRLHDLLLRIEADIESRLSTLDSILPSLSLPPSLSASEEENNYTSDPDLIHMRKELTSLFADYDVVAKRIRNLPLPPAPPLPASKGGKGSGKEEEEAKVRSAQERVQGAVWARALGFLQMHVGVLQRMPKPLTHKQSRSQTPSSSTSTPENEKVEIDMDAEAAHSLQPLLEQEALLESFIQEATAQRKFEDAKSLKANLAEIRGEIQRMVAASASGPNGNGNGKGSRRGR